MAEKGVLELLDPSKLISRKILMTEKFWNSHTVVQWSKSRQSPHNFDQLQESNDEF